jgi:beta-lactamase class A
MAIRFKSSKELKAKLDKVLEQIPERHLVHLSVLDLSSDKPVYAGFQDRKFVYPASIYKLYIAMTVLREVEKGRLDLLETKVRITKRNIVSKVEEQVASDPRPLLTAGMRVQLCELLDLMITRSDNTAANTLVDLVTREKINRLIRRYGWQRSEVTRKFLPREAEDPKYREAKPTVTSTRHLTEFLYLMGWGNWGYSFTSFLHDTLTLQRDETKISRGLPKTALFAHKTGWFSFRRDGKLVGVTGDCGIVEDGKKHYIVSCIVVLPNKHGNRLLAQIGKRLHALM